ncbi:response regulator transcription factor [Paenibacillus thalictri]|uniref:Response regulator n=1 Tax=Paenibacillus thalictri TaxID=2527873 RepID=A0A4Q9DIR7_9BACL|nr:response regulator [Paenibacillus thalictri]TBL73229.1 response regulator [Paenibacillus thalictri]
MSWKALLVDDEWLVRRELRHLVNWEEIGYTLVGEAANGLAAAEMIKEERPDLVVLDIQMPGMDGVELARHIAAHEPQIRMLVISSHDQFDYVKNTLKSGASDYLLKHELNPDNLRLVLGSIRKELEQDRAREREEERTETERKDSYSPLLRQFVRELVLGYRPAVQQWMSAYPYTGSRSALLVIQIAHFFRLSQGKTDTERSQFIQSVLDICQQSIGTMQHGCAVYIDHGRFVILIGCAGVRSESAIYQELSHLEGAVSRSLHLLLNVKTACQLAGVCTSAGLLPEMYARVTEKLRYMSGMEVNAPAEMTSNSDAHEQLFSIQQEKQLLTAVIGAAEDEIRMILDEVLKPVLGRSANDARLRLLLCELMSLARKVAVKIGFQQLDVLEARLEQLALCEDTAESGEQLKRVFTYLSQALGEKPSYSPYVQQAIQFIRHHYHEEIGLDRTAKQLNLSPAYLSRLFKSETGVGMVEYINRIRVEAGMKLLQSGEISVKEVYEKVGFNNYSYFFRVFKEITGQTPQQAAKREQDS